VTFTAQSGSWKATRRKQPHWGAAVPGNPGKHGGLPLQALRVATHTAFLQSAPHVGAGPRACPPVANGTLTAQSGSWKASCCKQPHRGAAIPGNPGKHGGLPLQALRVVTHPAILQSAPHVGADPRACPPVAYGTLTAQSGSWKATRRKQPHRGAAVPGNPGKHGGLPLQALRVATHTAFLQSAPHVGAGPRACPPVAYGTLTAQSGSWKATR